MLAYGQANLKWLSMLLLLCVLCHNNSSSKKLQSTGGYDYVKAVSCSKSIHLVVVVLSTQFHPLHSILPSSARPLAHRAHTNTHKLTTEIGGHNKQTTTTSTQTLNWQHNHNGSIDAGRPETSLPLAKRMVEVLFFVAKTLTILSKSRQLKLAFALPTKTWTLASFFILLLLLLILASQTRAIHIFIYRILEKPV